MEMKISRYAAALAALALAASPAAAQYDQDIEVEGKYVPEFIPRDRVGLFPRQMSFSLGESTLDYSLGGVHADFIPQAIPLPATGWKDFRDYSKERGYLSLGLGSWLQSTLSAGYRFVDSPLTTAGIRLQHNSTSLWKPEMYRHEYAGHPGDWKSGTRMERYDESIGVYASRLFEGKGRLDASLDYHLGYFDYYAFAPAGIPANPSVPAPDVPTQTLNDVAFRAAWNSPAQIDEISWGASAGVRYFGYRRFYVPSGTDGYEAVSGGRETRVNLSGNVVFPTSTSSSLGLDADVNILAYGKQSGSDDLTRFIVADPDTYGMVSLTPFYRFTRSRVNVGVGARIDLAFNAGAEDDRYSTFHIAPSVTADYNAGPVSVYLHALGGSRLHTLASDYELDYYQAPFMTCTDPVYSPLDAKLGITAGPFSGFHIGADIAYRVSRGEYYGGLYQMWLSGVSPTLLGAPAEEDGRPLAYAAQPGYKSNLSGFSFGVNAGYDGGAVFRCDAEARYQPQDGNTGYFNGFDRPRLTLSATAETNPWSTLKFKVGFDLRALRGFPVAAYFADSSILNGGPDVMISVPNLAMLNFGVSYGITSKIDVWAQADNLLNRRNRTAPFVPEPGLRLSAGAGFIF